MEFQIHRTWLNENALCNDIYLCFNERYACKLVFYLPCALGIGQLGGGDKGLEKIGLSNIQKISNKTMSYPESSLATEQYNSQ